MRALLCEPMGEPTVINIEDDLFALQRLLGNHVDIADDFMEPIAVAFNDVDRDREPGIGNVFFFCDSKGNLRHSMSGKILVLGIKNDLPCSLTDEQVKRYARTFRSSVLYFPMQDEREQSYHTSLQKEVKSHERTGR